MQRLCIAAMTAALAGPLLGPAALAVGPRHIVVTTDRSINCSTLKTIVEDVTRGCTTPQQKAVALYNFMIRAVYMPYDPNLPQEMIRDQLRFVNDPLKYINVYGACGCGPQAGVFLSLVEAAGLQGRLLDPGFGHVSSEVNWDGAWHWLDVWLPAYVLDGNGGIYSYDDVMADRTRFTQARQQARAPGNFMVNYEEDLPTVMNAKDYKPRGQGAYTQEYVEDLCLRPGESCTWLWGNVGKWYWPKDQFWAGPACKFIHDEVLTDAFPYWEPYRKEFKGGPHPWSDVYYRYYGNAIFLYEPALSQQGLQDAHAVLENIAFLPDGGLAPAKPDKASLLLDVTVPYVIADTVVEIQADPAGGTIRLAYSVDGGKYWTLAAQWQDALPPGFTSIGKPNSPEYPAGTTSGQYAYKLRVELVPGQAESKPALKQLKITTITMLNFYSRPWLELGSNKVTVTVANPESLAETPLQLTWRWLEDWTRPRQHSHTLAASGQAYTIEAAGTKRPKMASVTLSCPRR